MARRDVLIADAGDREAAPDVVILITDGRPTLEVDQYATEVYKLKQVRNRDQLIYLSRPLDFKRRVLYNIELLFRFRVESASDISRFIYTF